VRDQCQAAGVPFFMKQMGGWPYKRGNLEDIPEDLRIRQFPEVKR
jgi:protein gp37